MRTVVVHLTDCTEARVATTLDAAYPGPQGTSWVELVDGDPCLFIEFYRDLELESEPTEVELLRAQLRGALPAVSVAAHVSGRHPGVVQVHRFVELLLGLWPGVASDDFTEAPWTLAEVRSGRNGTRFFDCLTHYDRNRQ